MRSRATQYDLVQIVGPGIVILLFMCLGFSLASPMFLSMDNGINILRQASPLFIASAGQMLVILVAGIDISTGAVVAASSISGALATMYAGPVAGILVSIMFGMAAGAVNGTVAAYFKVQPVIATIGMLSMARGVAFLLTGGLPVVIVSPSFLFVGNGSVAGIPVLIIVAAVVAFGVAWWLAMTTSGRALFAIGGSEDAARAAGIQTRSLTVLAYSVAGGLAGLAAVIYSARSASGQSTFGYGLELETIAAVVLGGTVLGGGKATVLGTVLGAIIITVLANGMDLTGVSPYTQRVVLGVSLVLIVLIDQMRRCLPSVISKAH